MDVFDPLRHDDTIDSSGAPAMPIGAWFHVEMWLKRATDATGEVSVYQDGVSVLHLTHPITDDSTFQQWYVGNLSTNMNPVESTLYVDDVSVSGHALTKRRAWLGDRIRVLLGPIGRADAWFPRWGEPFE
jgi:hypothetical protein